MTAAAFDRRRFEVAYRARIDRIAALCRERGHSAVIATVGAEMPWLIGYQAMPLERITAAVVTGDGEARLVIPQLEAPRFRPLEGVEVLGWRDGEDPFRLVASMLPREGSVLVTEGTRAGWLFQLFSAAPSVRFSSAETLTAEVRAIKDEIEVRLLTLAAEAADRVAARLRDGEIPVIGRTEREVSAAIAAALLEEGHVKVNFAIVASGPNSASPHHEASDRVIGAGDILVTDFGGTFSAGGEPGYCSDITRTFAVGDPEPAGFFELYSTLQTAQEAAASGIRAGMSGSEADALAREPIAAAGYGDCFIHRLGHGIGLEEHEEPYLAPGEHSRLADGMAFSIEPGIYVQGRYGARIEDIAILSGGRALRLNHAPRDLVILSR